MAFLKEKTVLLWKKESTAYTQETSLTGTNGCIIENVSFKYDIPVKDVPLAINKLEPSFSLAGKRSVSFSFDVPMYYSGTPGTAPAYFDLLEACAMEKTQYGSTGVSMTPDSQLTNVPITVVVQLLEEGSNAAVTKFAGYGCMSSVKLATSGVGDYIKMSFEFKGIAVAPTDTTFGQFITPTYTEYHPSVVLGVGVTLFGEGQQINSFTVDLANQVELYTDPTNSTGYGGAHVVNRMPTIELDPMLKTVALQGDYARTINNTSGAFVAQIDGPIVISAPAAQYTQIYQVGDREGYYIHQKKLILNKSSGDDCLEILHGSKT